MQDESPGHSILCLPSLVSLRLLPASTYSTSFPQRSFQIREEPVTIATRLALIGQRRMDAVGFCIVSSSHFAPAFAQHALPSFLMLFVWLHILLHCDTFLYGPTAAQALVFAFGLKPACSKVCYWYAYLLPNGSFRFFLQASGFQHFPRLLFCASWRVRFSQHPRQEIYAVSVALFTLRHYIIRDGALAVPCTFLSVLRHCL